MGQDLPDITEEAILQGWAAISGGDEPDIDVPGPGLSHMPVRMPARDTALRAIAAAWPDLYAAALRHAADELDRDYVDKVNDVAINDEAERALTILRRMSLRDIATLRRLADEATVDDSPGSANCACG